MEKTYTYEIFEVIRRVNDHAITAVDWRMIAWEGERTAQERRATSFTPDADSADFIPYADVTTANLEAWIEAAEGADEITALKTKLADMIEFDKNLVPEETVQWT